MKIKTIKVLLIILLVLMSCNNQDSIIQPELLITAKTDTNEILLLTKLYSGHGGQAGRFDYIRSLAKQYAFIIDAFKKDEKKIIADKD